MFVNELIEQNILQIYVRNLLNCICYIDPQKEGIQKTLRILQSFEVFDDEKKGES